MRIQVFETSQEAATALAARIAGAVREKPALVLGLPAGKTPIPVYAELRRLHADGLLDLSRVEAFTLDEFVGLGAGHPASFRRFMDANLFEGVNVAPSRIHALDGSATDLDDECRRYEAAIASVGGIDFQVLGIGVNGHIGFNEPGDALESETHRVVLHDETRRQNAGAFGGDVVQVPTTALSMGMGTILKAATIAVIATGERKAHAIAGMVRGPLTTRCPASFLQTHPRVEVYADRAAAARV